MITGCTQTAAIMSTFIIHHLYLEQHQRRRINESRNQKKTAKGHNSIEEI